VDQVLEFDGRRIPHAYRRINTGELKPIYVYNQRPSEVDSVGLGCCLIKRKVFEKIGSKFEFNNDVGGEDINFCKRAQDAGFLIHVDPDVQCGHIGETVYKIGDNVRYEYR